MFQEPIIGKASTFSLCGRVVGELTQTAEFVPPTPEVADGLIGWWDFSLDDSITRHNGDPTVVSILDLSSTGATMLAPADANRPTTVTNSGIQWGVFDASIPTCLNTDGTPFNFGTGSDFEIYVVYRYNDHGTTARCIFGKGDDDERFSIFANASSVAGQNNARFENTAGTPVNMLKNDGYDDNEPHFAHFGRHTSGTTIFHMSDLSAISEVGLVGSFAGTEPLWFAGFDSAVGDPAFFGFTGHIGEALVYNRELTAGERNTIAAYLRAKWGIA